MSQAKLVVTYTLSGRAPEWVWDCLDDGDYSGVLEWVAQEHPEKISVE